MTRYSLGFAFDWDRRSVLLIQKDHPEWQAGKYNGIGGKVDLQDKDIVDCMVREFREETGIQTKAEDWDHKMILFGENYEVWVYTTLSNISTAIKMPGCSETPRVIEISTLIVAGSMEKNRYPVVDGNVYWMIFYCLDMDAPLTKVYYNMLPEDKASFQS